MEDPRNDEGPLTPEGESPREASAVPTPATPKLELVERSSATEGPSEEDRAADSEGRRAQKVAEARIKILNGYYARSDVQRELAERLIYELGA